MSSGYPTHRWIPGIAMRYRLDDISGKHLQQLWIEEGHSPSGGPMGGWGWVPTGQFTWRDVPIQSTEMEDPMYWCRKAPPPL
jgi:hypothetical protein